MLDTSHGLTKSVSCEEELRLDHETLKDLDATAIVVKGGLAKTEFCQAAGDNKTQTSYR